MEYRYRVKDGRGQDRRGILEADNRMLVLESLVGQGFYVLELEKVEHTGLSMEIRLPMPVRVPPRELAAFTRQLATMINAGLPILKCFAILGQQVQDRALRAAVLDIRENLEAGMSLFTALNKYPRIFSRLYVSMVRTGELGGILDEVLERLAEHLEREQEISARVKSASIYPIIISGFAVLVVVFIITLVMPTFTGMFTAAGVPLPGPTRMLLEVGVFLQNGWYLLLAGLILTITVMKQWKKTWCFDFLLLKLPVIGDTVSRLTVARFARTMSILIQSGIPVLTALEAVEEVVDNKVVAHAIRKSRAGVREGDTISGPLAATGVFEPMVIQMIAVGEETGTLDDMLSRVANYFDREVMYLTDALMSIIEPILIMLVTVLVGGIILATMLPMFDMIQFVGERM